MLLFCCSEGIRAKKKETGQPPTPRASSSAASGSFVGNSHTFVVEHENKELLIF
jgi:hypothetical protein